MTKNQNYIIYLSISIALISIALILSYILIKRRKNSLKLPNPQNPTTNQIPNQSNSTTNQIYNQSNSTTNQIPNPQNPATNQIPNPQNPETNPITNPQSPKTNPIPNQSNSEVKPIPNQISNQSNSEAKQIPNTISNQPNPETNPITNPQNPATNQIPNPQNPETNPIPNQPNPEVKPIPNQPNSEVKPIPNQPNSETNPIPNPQNPKTNQIPNQSNSEVKPIPNQPNPETNQATQIELPPGIKVNSLKEDFRQNYFLLNNFYDYYNKKNNNRNNSQEEKPFKFMDIFHEGLNIQDIISNLKNTNIMQFIKNLLETKTNISVKEILEKLDKKFSQEAILEDRLLTFESLKNIQSAMALFDNTKSKKYQMLSLGYNIKSYEENSTKEEKNKINTDNKEIINDTNIAFSSILDTKLNDLKKGEELYLNILISGHWTSLKASKIDDGQIDIYYYNSLGNSLNYFDEIIFLLKTMNENIQFYNSTQILDNELKSFLDQKKEKNDNKELPILEKNQNLEIQENQDLVNRIQNSYSIKQKDGEFCGYCSLFNLEKSFFQDGLDVQYNSIKYDDFKENMRFKSFFLLMLGLIQENFVNNILFINSNEIVSNNSIYIDNNISSNSDQLNKKIIKTLENISDEFNKELLKKKTEAEKNLFINTKFNLTPISDYKENFYSNHTIKENILLVFFDNMVNIATFEQNEDAVEKINTLRKNMISEFYDYLLNSNDYIEKLNEIKNFIKNSKGFEANFNDKYKIFLDYINSFRETQINLMNEFFHIKLNELKDNNLSFNIKSKPIILSGWQMLFINDIVKNNNIQNWSTKDGISKIIDVINNNFIKYYDIDSDDYKKLKGLIDDLSIIRDSDDIEINLYDEFKNFYQNIFLKNDIFFEKTNLALGDANAILYNTTEQSA